jgi:hypothetical protein
MPEAERLEQGDLWFVATPRVRPRNVVPLRPDEPPHPREVQRLYLLLRPQGRPVYRRLLVGRNKLPESPRQRFWARIERVGDAHEVTQDLGRIEYDTETRGPRVRPPARLLAEGSYELARHGKHSHLAYRLGKARAPAEVLSSLRIEPRQNYIVAAFNPEATPRLGTSRGAKMPLPEWLQEKFGERRFAPLDLDLFDAAGLELVLIGGNEEAARSRTRDLPRLR